MANLKYGSTGDDVKKLQKALGFTGKDVDGIFGKNTQKAVIDYQKKNGLAVDGIAGKNTLGKLYSVTQTAAAKAPKASSSSSSSSSAAIAPAAVTTQEEKTDSTGSQGTAKASSSSSSSSEEAKQETAKTSEVPAFTYEEFTYDPFTYDPYAQSDVVKQANALLQEHINGKPGAYQSQWQAQINDYLNQIQNREPFSYDFNSDAMYQMYKDMFTQQGQMAMMDTMGQAAALTGGYGNSYAQTVGQQAYNQQLSQLNDVIPELYQMSYGRYADEGQRLQDMYSMYVGLENQDYGRYQDNLDNWYTQLDYLTDRYEAESEADYNRYLHGYNQAFDNYTTQREAAYDNHTAQEDLRWKQYLADQEKEQTAAELMAGAGDYGRLADVYGLSEDEVKAIKDANTPVYTGGTGVGGDDVKEYTKLTHDHRQLMNNELAKLETVVDICSTVNQYLGMGYNPSQIKDMADTPIRNIVGSITTPGDLESLVALCSRLGYSSAEINDLTLDKAKELGLYKDPGLASPMAQVQADRRNKNRIEQTF